MEYWKRVDLGDYKTYSSQVLDYFKLYPDKFWRTTVSPNVDYRSTLLGNALNPLYFDDFLHKVPGLKEGSAKFGPMSNVAILVMHDNNVSLHVDNPSRSKISVAARINVPLLNCEGSLTAFYQFTDEQYEQSIINPAGVRLWPLSWRTKFTPVTTVELTEPTIIRTSAPHTVFTDKCQYPRIVLTIAFANDVVQYL